MTTNRSLNKLERRAHMNIHNTKPVVEGELHPDDCFTRDRFGKKQIVKKEDHSFRKNSKKAAIALFFLSTFSCPAFAAASKNTNISVESDVKDLSFLNEKPSSDARPTFYMDNNTSVDINENGDPNMNLRF